MSKPETSHEDAHWKRWLGDPQVGALTIAVFCCLEGLDSCQYAAETWFQLSANLLHRRHGPKAMRRSRAIQRWARFLCQEWELDRLSLSDHGLCIAVANVLGACVYHAAKDVQEADASLHSSRDLIDLLKRWVPTRALDHLLKITEWRPPPELGFRVLAPPSELVAPISVQACPEIVSAVGGMRVRPHQFRAEGTDIGGCDIRGFRVAQVAQEVWPNGTVEESQCDTMQEDNPELPFWPHTREKSKPAFSHRCSVRSVNEGLEWSDWPQVPVRRSGDGPPIWRFLTGVFRLGKSRGVTEYDLLARCTWEIDWRES